MKIYFFLTLPVFLGLAVTLLHPLHWGCGMKAPPSSGKLPCLCWEKLKRQWQQELKTSAWKHRPLFFFPFNLKGEWSSPVQLWWGNRSFSRKEQWLLRGSKTITIVLKPETWHLSVVMEEEKYLCMSDLAVKPGQDFDGTRVLSLLWGQISGPEKVPEWKGHEG